MSARPRLAAALILVAATLLAAGCAPVENPRPTATRLPPGVSASIVQLRGDVAARQAQVEIRNDSESPLEIGSVTVEDERFLGVARRVVARDSEIAPGQAVSVRMQLPGMNCAAPDTGTPLMTVGYTLGPSSSVAIAPLDDPLDFLPALHAGECLAAAFGEAGAVSFTGFTPAPSGQAGRLELTVAAGDGSAELTAVHRTNLLGFSLDTAAETYPLAVRSAAQASVVSIPIVPFRCDAHAVQEDKRGTVFTFDVVTGTGSGRADIAAPPEMRAGILAWVSEWCGFGAR